MILKQLLRFAEAGDLEAQIAALSVKSVLIASVLLVVLLALAALVINDKDKHHIKKPLFILITLTIVIPTLIMSVSTVYLNVKSESGGPVHWHTDIEFWVCNQEVELRDPTEFLSNKVGTSTYHEHDDKRIHLEGVVVKKDYDASLEKFMDVTGGEITNSSVRIPTNENIFENDVDGDDNTGNRAVVETFVENTEEGEKVVSVQNGQNCGEGDPAELQAFLLRYNKEDDTYYQTKLEDPGSYIMRDESIVPPGDCLIVEFDQPKDRTNYLCQQYGVRDAERCTEFGVSTYNPELCNIRQVPAPIGGEI